MKIDSFNTTHNGDATHGQLLPEEPYVERKERICTEISCSYSSELGKKLCLGRGLSLVKFSAQMSTRNFIHHGASPGNLRERKREGFDVRYDYDTNRSWVLGGIGGDIDI